MSERIPDAPRRSMLAFAGELPNLVSLAGLLCALLGIYFAIQGNFAAAMIGLVWAIAFDWFDGRIARGMAGRSDKQREYGAQLDSLIDVVSFGVAPAVVLLSLGHFSPWFLPGAFVALGASVTRLAYFNIFGLAEDGTYRGLALDNNVILLIAAFALQPLMSGRVFAMGVYALILVLAALNISPIRTPKFAGGWYYAVVAYALAMTALFTLRLLQAA
ncbi:MAG: CDP-alcohol phosphatidyltransferase [Coriobacteriia bacterium]|nr:CDP-alcohol phosphatidyltransferase [Coriobacteriia bacterium]